MGILSGKMLFFYIITIIILIVLVIFILKKHNLIYLCRLQLLFAGFFIDANIFGYDFPIFNIADSSLTIGVIFVIITLIKDAIINKKEV